MNFQISLLWTCRGKIDRAPYIVAGVLLFAIKFAIDWTIANVFFGENWSPINYLIWPNHRVVRALEVGPERDFSLTMLAVSLPFIWMGVNLTMNRLRSAQLPLLIIVLFFVPLVNLLLFSILVVLPKREAQEPKSIDADLCDEPASAPAMSSNPMRDTHITEEQPPRPTYRRRSLALREIHRSIVLESRWRSGLVALLVTVPLAMLAVALGAHVLESYGLSLFIAAPFMIGLISVLVFGFSRRQSFGDCMQVAFYSTALAGLGVVLVALEGLVCLVMAAPIAFFLSFLGALVGYTIQDRPWLNDYSASISLLMILMLPSLMAAESVNEPTPQIRAIETEMIIDAPPAMVWRHVIAFPPLAEPTDWLFQIGLAYPQRAEIDGVGAGAVRRCIFSTGTFVEPIDVWDEPKLLRFRVTDQPAPMEEWSPYHIHPAHLDHYLRSHQGQFLLEELPGGRTRLVGTTWYSNRMWPAPYWNMWSDYIIHRIHGRVLMHIQELAKSEVRR